jgi:hypothetical protein
LHQVAGIQADVRDLAVLRGLDDGLRARTHAAAVHQIGQFFDSGGHVKGTVLDSGHHQLAGHQQRLAANLFMRHADDDFVDTPRAGLAGAAVAVRGAGQGLQFQRDVFEDVAWPGAGFQPLQKAAAHARAAAVFDQARQPS